MARGSYGRNRKFPRALRCQPQRRARREDALRALRALRTGLVFAVRGRMHAIRRLPILRFTEATTLHAYAWARPDVYPMLAKERVLGTWSAPLDDVFIHFDFARETA